jgi:hypothetical protein
MRLPFLAPSAILLAAALAVAACTDPEEQLPGGFTPEPTPQATTAATPEPSPLSTPDPDWTPVPVPADWREHRDTDLGFAVRYPQDLEFEWVTGPEPDRGQLVLNYRSPSDVLRVFIIHIATDHEFDPIPEGVSPEDWAIGRVCARDKIEEASLGGRHAITCPFLAAEEHPPLTEVITTHRGGILRLSISPYLGEAEIEGIRGAFQFLAEEDL